MLGGLEPRDERGAEERMTETRVAAPATPRPELGRSPVGADRDADRRPAFLVGVQHDP